MNLETDCNAAVDHVPDGAGNYIDGICDPAAGFFIMPESRKTFGKIYSKSGHREIELALKFYF